MIEIIWHYDLQSNVEKKQPHTAAEARVWLPGCPTAGLPNCAYRDIGGGECCIHCFAGPA